MSRNTEYQFVSTDTEKLEALMISAYEKITKTSVTPASPEKLFIRWVAGIILQERALNNYTGNQNIPSRAEGANLDALGELFYASERPAAQAAVCTMRFSISAAQATAILIPAGTRVTDASSTLFWETTEDVYVPIGDTYVDTSVRCQTAGVSGNGYAEGQINTIVDVYDYYSSCSNLTASDGGADEASDEEYYALLLASMYAYSTAGPTGAYVYHAKAVSTEIADVKAVRPRAVRSEAVPVYTLSGAGYAFLGGDELDIETLSVFPHGGSTAAIPGTDYTAEYADGLLRIAVDAGGALAASTQIDVNVETTGAGRVVIYTLMDDGTVAGDEIKSAVLAACNDSSVRPLSDLVSVADPELVDYNINLTYYVAADSMASAADIRTAVEAAVEKYKAWQCGKLGRDINPSVLIGYLMQVSGVKRVALTSPVYTALHDGSDEYIPQVAGIGTTSIVAGGVEHE